MMPTKNPTRGAASIEKAKFYRRSNSIGSTSSDASVNSESSVVDLLEEKRRLAIERHRQPIPRFYSRSSSIPRTSTTTASAATRVRGTARCASAGATTTNRRPTASLHYSVAAATKMKMKNTSSTTTIPTNKIPAHKKTNKIDTTSRHSCNNTACSSDCHDDHSQDLFDDEGMTVLEILAEKRRLAGRTPRCFSDAATTTTTSATTRALGVTRTRSAPATVGIRRTRSVCRGGDSSSEKQQYKTATDDDTLQTMPGAIFVPGFDSVESDEDESEVDDFRYNNNNDEESNNKTMSDLPVLRYGQSSGDANSSTEDSVHEGVAVATKVDEQDVPHVNAVPMIVEDGFEKKTKQQKIPFRKTMLLCRFSLILFMSLCVVALATITIIAIHSSDRAGHSQEDLGIRNEIALLVGSENLESADSPYTSALEWIIQQDPMQPEPSGVDADSNQHLVQRYIMAYVYFATTTNGPWRSCNPPVGNETEFCYLLELQYIFEMGQEKQVPSTRWLTSVHECQFAGVVCNSNSQVIRLALNGQQLSGSFPEGIVHLPFLESIEFLAGSLSGPFPKDIIALTNLVNVNLGHNKLSGEVPIEWWQSSQFVHLNLQNNSLLGSIPSNIKLMKKIKALFLEGNKFTGTIPPEIGELKESLESIYLSDNDLHGPIPTELGQLERLDHLFLDRNHLTGTLPTQLGKLTKMLEFRVHQNNLLGGDIPESLYNMKNLFLLDLADCNFTGTISPMVGKLKDMTHFLIHGNSLTGILPVELATRMAGSSMAKSSKSSSPQAWRKNGDMQVQDNNFQGTMPLEFCDLGNFKTLIADCAPDPVTGHVELQCDCCTACFDKSEGRLYNSYQEQMQQQGQEPQVEQQRQRPTAAAAAADENMGRLRYPSTRQQGDD